MLRFYPCTGTHGSNIDTSPSLVESSEEMKNQSSGNEGASGSSKNDSGMLVG